MFWLTQSEVDSVERKHYDEILRYSFQKSREIVWFSVTTKNSSISQAELAGITTYICQY